MNGVKKRTDVENFKDFDRVRVEKQGFLTFSTDFSTKNHAAVKVFNCPEKFLLPFCNLRLQRKNVENVF